MQKTTEKKIGEVSLNKITEKLVEYLLDFLYMPWIVVWGLVFLQGIFVWYYQTNKLTDFAFELSNFFSEQVFLPQFFFLTTFFVFFNYTLSFLLKKRYPKLQYFFFAQSLLIVFFLFLIIWPHLLIIISTRS